VTSIQASREAQNKQTLAFPSYFPQRPEPSRVADGFAARQDGDEHAPNPHVDPGGIAGNSAQTYSSAADRVLSPRVRQSGQGLIGCGCLLAGTRGLWAQGG
jgi:hypothetical protein